MGKLTPLTSISLVLWVNMWGKYQTSGNDYRWYSYMDEDGSEQPPKMVTFATSNYTVGGSHAPVGQGHEFAFSDGNVSFLQFHDTYPPEYRVLKDVKKSQFNFSLNIKSSGNGPGAGTLIYRYCGKDCCLLLWPYAMDATFLSFYLKGGQVGSDGKVDPNNHGELYYCRQGMKPGAYGITFYRYLEEKDDNTVNYTAVDFNSNEHGEVIWLKPLGTSVVDPHFSFDWTSVCDYSPPSGDDSVNVDCDFCISKITDCCNDNAFTSDLNEFSSLVTPDPYINSENGEEERTTYNANVHIAKVLRQSFKTFYALFSKISCQLEASLKANNKEKESIDKIVKALEKMDNHPEIIVSPSENVFVSRVRYNIDADE